MGAQGLGFIATCGLINSLDLRRIPRPGYTRPRQGQAEVVCKGTYGPRAPNERIYHLQGRATQKPKDPVVCISKARKGHGSVLEVEGFKTTVHFSG